MRQHFRDEEPDDDEIPFDEERLARLDELTAGYCPRCGVRGHDGKDCPTVTPDLLKNQWG